MKTVNISKSVHSLVKENPNLKEDLIEIGFTPLSDEKMVNTVGRMISPKDGTRQIGITLDELKNELENRGYEVEE